MRSATTWLALCLVAALLQEISSIKPEDEPEKERLTSDSKKVGKRFYCDPCCDPYYVTLRRAIGLKGRPYYQHHPNYGGCRYGAGNVPVSPCQRPRPDNGEDIRNGNYCMINNEGLPQENIENCSAVRYDKGKEIIVYPKSVCNFDKGSQNSEINYENSSGIESYSSSFNPEAGKQTGYDQGLNNGFPSEDSPSQYSVAQFIEQDTPFAGGGSVGTSELPDSENSNTFTTSPFSSQSRDPTSSIDDPGGEYTYPVQDKGVGAQEYFTSDKISPDSNGYPTTDYDKTTTDWTALRGPATNQQVETWYYPDKPEPGNYPGNYFQNTDIPPKEPTTDIRTGATDISQAPKENNIVFPYIYSGINNPSETTYTQQPQALINYGKGYSDSNQAGASYFFKAVQDENSGYDTGPEVKNFEYGSNGEPTANFNTGPNTNQAGESFMSSGHAGLSYIPEAQKEKPTDTKFLSPEMNYGPNGGPTFSLLTKGAESKEVTQPTTFSPYDKNIGYLYEPNALKTYQYPTTDMKFLSPEMNYGPNGGPTFSFLTKGAKSKEVTQPTPFSPYDKNIGYVYEPITLKTGQYPTLYRYKTPFSDLKGYTNKGSDQPPVSETYEQVDEAKIDSEPDKQESPKYIMTGMPFNPQDGYSTVGEGTFPQSQGPLPLSLNGDKPPISGVEDYKNQRWDQPSVSETYDQKGGAQFVYLGPGVPNKQESPKYIMTGIPFNPQDSYSTVGEGTFSQSQGPLPLSLNGDKPPFSGVEDYKNQGWDQPSVSETYDQKGGAQFVYLGPGVPNKQENPKCIMTGIPFNPQDSYSTVGEGTFPQSQGPLPLSLNGDKPPFSGVEDYKNQGWDQPSVSETYDQKGGAQFVYLGPGVPNKQESPKYIMTGIPFNPQDSYSTVGEGTFPQSQGPLPLSLNGDKPPFSGVEDYKNQGWDQPSVSETYDQKGGAQFVYLGPGVPNKQENPKCIMTGIPFNPQDSYSTVGEGTFPQSQGPLPLSLNGDKPPFSGLEDYKNQGWDQPSVSETYDQKGGAQIVYLGPEDPDKQGVTDSAVAEKVPAGLSSTPSNNNYLKSEMNGALLQSKSPLSDWRGSLFSQANDRFPFTPGYSYEMPYSDQLMYKNINNIPPLSIYGYKYEYPPLLGTPQFSTPYYETFQKGGQMPNIFKEDEDNLGNTEGDQRNPEESSKYDLTIGGPSSLDSPGKYENEKSENYGLEIPDTPETPDSPTSPDTSRPDLSATLGDPMNNGAPEKSTSDGTLIDGSENTSGPSPLIGQELASLPKSQSDLTDDNRGDKVVPVNGYYMKEEQLKDIISSLKTPEKCWLIIPQVGSGPLPEYIHLVDYDSVNTDSASVKTCGGLLVPLKQLKAIANIYAPDRSLFADESGTVLSCGTFVKYSTMRKILASAKDPKKVNMLTPRGTMVPYSIYSKYMSKLSNEDKDKLKVVMSGDKTPIPNKIYNAVLNYFASKSEVDPESKKEYVKLLGSNIKIPLSTCLTILENANRKIKDWTVTLPSKHNMSFECFLRIAEMLGDEYTQQCMVNIANSNVSIPYTILKYIFEIYCGITEFDLSKKDVDGNCKFCTKTNDNFSGDRQEGGFCPDFETVEETKISPCRRDRVKSCRFYRPRSKYFLTEAAEDVRQESACSCPQRYRGSSGGKSILDILNPEETELLGDCPPTDEYCRPRQRKC